MDALKKALASVSEKIGTQSDKNGNNDRSSPSAGNRQGGGGNQQNTSVKPRNRKPAPEAANITHVCIPKYRSKNSYVEYVVECTKMGTTWQVNRRYQQFRVLHAQLTAMCPMSTPYHCEFGVVPVLVSSSWTEVTNSSPELVERRRRYLEIYLEQLLVPKNGFYNPRTPLYAFLHDGEIPVNSRTAVDRLIPGLGANAPVVDMDDPQDDAQQVVACTQDTSAPNLHVDFMKPMTQTVSPSTLALKEDMKAPVLKEECTQCGYQEDITYSLEGWDEFGPCKMCNQYTTWRLVGEIQPPELPPDNPDGEETTDAVACSRCQVEFTTQLRAVICKNCGKSFCGYCTQYTSLVQGHESEQRVCAECKDILSMPIENNTTSNVATTPVPSTGAQCTTGIPTPMSDESLGVFPDVPIVQPPPVTLDDFEMITTLGKGTFGKVMKVRHKKTGETYAMKVLSKQVIHKRRMVDYIKEEKNILSQLRHPFVVTLHWAFQTEHHLYLVLDFLPGGELFTHIYHQGRLGEADAKFYLAEVVLALDHLHRHDIVHRDIKPENIVLDRCGHATLTDFGLARSHFSKSRRRSFVGSAEYLSPETVKGEPQTHAVDWWSVGVMMYEMLCGVAPFNAPNNNDVYQAILHKQIDWSGLNVSPEACSLLKRLLTKDVRNRLTDATLIKRHPFFHGIDWRELFLRRIPPPFVPDLTHNDTKYFSKDFTSEWAGVQADNRFDVDLGTRFSNFESTGIPARGNRPESLVLDDAAPIPFPKETADGANPLPESIPNHGISTTFVNPESFFGLWRFVKLELVTTDGRVSYPWGSDVVGLLSYTRSGTFSMQLCPARRSKFKDSQYNKVTKEEMSKAYTTYVASFGTFEVVPGRSFINHKITASLCPNWNNTEQRRYFTILPLSTKASLPAPAPEVRGSCIEVSGVGTVLTLATQTQDVGDGVMAKTSMTWEKIEE